MDQVSSAAGKRNVAPPESIAIGPHWARIAAGGGVGLRPNVSKLEALSQSVMADASKFLASLVRPAAASQSVLMRTIISLVARRSGTIEIIGQYDGSAQGAAGRWRILFQQGALFSSLTVRHNVQFPLREDLLSQGTDDEIAIAKPRPGARSADPVPKMPIEPDQDQMGADGIL
jgi:hypothetical protein